MKTKTRNILVIVGIVASIILGIIGYGAYSIYSFFSRFSAREIPVEIKESRVLLGKEFLTRIVFFHHSQESIIKTIGDGTKIKDEKERQKMVQSQIAKGISNFEDLEVFREEVIAVGKFGGYFFDLNGNLKRHIAFDPTVEKVKIGPYEQDTYQSGLDNLRIVHLDRDKLGFLSFGSMQGTRVFDESGEQIWSFGNEKADLSILFKDEKEQDADYEKRIYVMEAAVGDLDGDGVSEYIVARKKDGVRAFDRNGVERWFQPADFPSGKLKVHDLDGDGKNELLQLGESVRDGNGRFVRKLKDSDSLLFVEDKDHKIKIQFLDFSDGKLIYSDEVGNKLFEVNAPLSEIKKEAKKVDVPGHPELSYTDDSENIAYPKAVWVTLRKDKPKYLAIVASFIGLPRANLYVYEQNGTLVYHELLEEDVETIAVVPLNDGKEQLLVGGKDSIWRYAAN